MKQYDGLKHTDDKSDSFWLAQQKQLGILPQGYIYPKEERPIRDLLRRRLMFVRQRTAQLLSLQSMITRNLGLRLSGGKIKGLRKEDLESMFDSKHLVLMATAQLDTIRFLQEIARGIEKEVLSQIKFKKEFEMLVTVPGIGNILGLTIMLEVGDINRFKKVGNYSSYCRCVKSERLSNDKKKGKGNRKNGNKYLSWAYVEAANFAIRFCPQAQKFYQRKASKKNRVVALKSLSNKIARATYYMMRDQIPFDVDKLFK
jgi:transposase